MGYSHAISKNSKVVTVKKQRAHKATRHTSKALLLSVVLAVFASLSLFMPSALQAQAEGAANNTSYAMSIGGEALKDGAARQASDDIKAKFYLGEAAHGDDPSSSNESPILWDILGPANTNTTDPFNFSEDGTYTGTVGGGKWGVFPSAEATEPINDQILAISENVTEKSQFNPNKSDGNVYYAHNSTTEGKTSTLYSALHGAFSGYFNPSEQAFIGYTSKADAEDGNFAKSTDASQGQGNPADILYNARLFPLSAREAETYYKDSSQRIASGAFNLWWLRSASSGNSYRAGVVYGGGSVNAHDVGNTCGVRAAFNSNLNSLIFTSLSGTNYVLPAYDTGTAELTSMAVENTPQVPTYRLTLLDTTLNTCTPKSTSQIKAAAGSTVTLGYEGAVAKNSAYVTCYIADAEGNILYAGHIAKTDKAAGEAQVKIPEVLPAGNYSLVVYEEQDNNCTAGNNVKGKLTNCAGEIKDDKNVIKLTVEAQPDKFSITYKAEEGGTVDPTAEEVQENVPAKGSTAKADLGYTFTNWTDEAGSIVSSDATFVPVQPDEGWQNTTYTAHFKKSDVPPEPPTPPAPPAPPVPPAPPTPTPDPDNPRTEEEQGWNFNESGGWYYVFDNEGNTYNDGWHWIEDPKFGAHWYYFKPDGFITTNTWIPSGDTWYFTDSSGAMAKGVWLFINGAWYGFMWDGTMCKGWTYDHAYNNWFYCDPQTGAMYTNCWAYINGAWYGFWANGEMCRGWVWDSTYHGWFYCAPEDGHMCYNGWRRIDNRMCYFNRSGLWVR